MKRAGHNADDFRIRPLRCCVPSNDVIPGVVQCEECTFARKLPQDWCVCFKPASLDREWTWLARQETIEGKNHDRITMRLRTYKVAVREFLASVEAKLKPFLYHKWLARFIRRQFHLECDRFNGIREAVLLADFATAMILGSGFKATCESDATANLYVVLVLYKRDGETKCDYVRIWSSAATCAPSTEADSAASEPALRRCRGDRNFSQFFCCLPRLRCNYFAW